MKKYPDEIADYIKTKIPINRHRRQELIDDINKRFGVNFSPNQFRDYCSFRGIKLTTARFRIQFGDEVVKTGNLIYIKQKDGTLKNKALVIYEAVYGPIKSDERIIFLDGDKCNFSLDNFFIVTEKELGHLGRAQLLTRDPIQTRLNIEYYRFRKKLKEQAKGLGLLNAAGEFKWEVKERNARYPAEKRREYSRRFREKMKNENPEKYKAWIRQCNELKKRRTKK